MSFMQRNFELSAIPAVTAAVVDWATVKYLLPAVGINHITSGTTMQMVIGWLVQAVAIYLGIVLGNYINNAIFYR